MNLTPAEFRATNYHWSANRPGYQMLHYASMCSGISVRRIQTGGRAMVLARLRWAVMYLLRRRHKWSLPRIAAFFGMDHKTVMHGIDRCEETLGNDEEYSTFVAGMDMATRRGVE